MAPLPPLNSAGAAGEWMGWGCVSAPVLLACFVSRVCASKLETDQLSSPTPHSFPFCRLARQRPAGWDPTLASEQLLHHLLSHRQGTISVPLHPVPRRPRRRGSWLPPCLRLLRGRLGSSLVSVALANFFYTFQLTGHGALPSLARARQLVATPILLLCECWLLRRAHKVSLTEKVTSLDGMMG